MVSVSQSLDSCTPVSQPGCFSVLRKEGLTTRKKTGSGIDMENFDSTRTKDFVLWHGEKQRIHNGQLHINFNIREIWFCHLGEKIGHEQDGRGKEFLRPVIIVKKFNREVCWAIPLTRRLVAIDHPFYFMFSFIELVKSSAILSQMRLLDAKRLKYKTGTMTKNDFVCLKIKLRQLLA